VEKEMRLIDADSLNRALIEEYHGMLSDETLKIYQVIRILDECPTVDAVEVVHGRLIETLVPDGYVQKASRLRKQCSVCGWTNACRYNYCPNCGAGMDGDGDG
jgi:hypothetical protein